MEDVSSIGSLSYCNSQQTDVPASSFAQPNLSMLSFLPCRGHYKGAERRSGLSCIGVLLGVFVMTIFRLHSSRLEAAENCA